ncbi:tyrosine-type recombinase/integrase [Qipengyuania proteolytica]|uniref:tyrosine-type recombinase/integrase n=1 Tax=Qipengyuania proteolytica TaxID=2867239 RepID=UPI001FFC2BC1|nr:site-specific integrase [Qipengyuania proteolytica]
MAAPPIGNVVIYDERLPGFGLRVTAKGARSFILNYRFKGRERRITIGQFPTWSAQAARNQAQRLRRDIDLGSDPLDHRNNERTAPTVRQLFERYNEEHLPTKAPRSAKDDRSMWANDILPVLANLKVADLTPSHCDDLHRRISRDRPVRANRVMEVLRKSLNLATRWGWIDRNPATGCRRNTEHKRHRYLQPDEIQRLIAALEAHSERISADALLFMLFTGCRRGEALGARWEQFHLDARIWVKPSAETKQRREHRVPYSSTVADILARRRAETDGAYVFPGRLGAPLLEVRKTWKSACDASGLEKVRIHDLRHTFASLVASSGRSLFVVGELLGHSSTQTTKRYANLYDDPLRSAAEDVASCITLSARGHPDVSRTMEDK